jgi:hypothetical protein
MEIGLSAEAVRHIGLEAAIALELIAKESDDGTISLEKLVEKGSHFDLTPQQISKATETLTAAGKVVWLNNSLCKAVGQGRQAWRLSQATGRRLRQFGLSPSQVKRLMASYLDSTLLDDIDEQEFVRFALRQVPTGHITAIAGWKPSQALVSSLERDGISRQFIEDALERFRDRYDHSRGGGDFDGNFRRFVRSTWSTAKKRISPFWLPGTETNGRLQRRGLSQKEVLSRALEFRLWAGESGRVSVDWDRQFEDYMLTLRNRNDKQQISGRLSFDTI